MSKGTDEEERAMVDSRGQQPVDDIDDEAQSTDLPPPPESGSMFPAEQSAGDIEMLIGHVGPDPGSSMAAATSGLASQVDASLEYTHRSLSTDLSTLPEFNLGGKAPEVPNLPEFDEYESAPDLIDVPAMLAQLNGPYDPTIHEVPAELPTFTGVDFDALAAVPLEIEAPVKPEVLIPVIATQKPPPPRSNAFAYTILTVLAVAMVGSFLWIRERTEALKPEGPTMVYKAPPPTKVEVRYQGQAVGMHVPDQEEPEEELVIEVDDSEGLATDALETAGETAAGETDAGETDALPVANPDEPAIAVVDPPQPPPGEAQPPTLEPTENAFMSGVNTSDSWGAKHPEQTPAPAQPAPKPAPASEPPPAVTPPAAEPPPAEPAPTQSDNDKPAAQEPEPKPEAKKKPKNKPKKKPKKKPKQQPSDDKSEQPPAPVEPRGRGPVDVVDVVPGG